MSWPLRPDSKEALDDFPAFMERWDESSGLKNLQPLGVFPHNPAQDDGLCRLVAAVKNEGVDQKEYRIMMVDAGLYFRVMQVCALPESYT
jgi:hypothetical protein